MNPIHLIFTAVACLCCMFIAGAVARAELAHDCKLVGAFHVHGKAYTCAPQHLPQRTAAKPLT